jgi:radical SAM superfamily enzyme YgiQ (UPF0313 family)
MNIVFVQAYDVNSPATFLSAPLGLYRVAFYLESECQGVSCDVCDPNLYHPEGQGALEGFLRNVSSKGPDIIAYSPLHYTLEWDIYLMHVAHKISPNSLHVVGGQHASFAFQELFKYCPFLDLGIVGEGERPMAEVVKKIQEVGLKRVKEAPWRELVHVPGARFPKYPQYLPNVAMSEDEFVEATFRLDFGERMRTNRYWEYVANNFPMKMTPSIARDVLSVKPYTTNFCPMGCSFCSTTQFYRDAGDSSAKIRSIRGRDLKNYLSSIKESCPNVASVYFKDDLWFLRGGTKEDLQEDMIAAWEGTEGTMGIFAKARADTFVDPLTLETDEELLDMARSCNFRKISIGIESFDATELDHYNKNLGPNGPEVNRRALSALRMYGIKPIAYLILSCDISTIDSIFTTVLNAVYEIEAGTIVKINPWLYSLPGTKLAAAHRMRDDLIEKIPIPGLFGQYVERIVEIPPNEVRAKFLMREYKKRSKVLESDAHGIVFHSTPLRLRSLVLCGIDLNFHPVDTNTGQPIDLQMLSERLSAFIASNIEEEEFSEA